jgi:hypothetical protein
MDSKSVFVQSTESAPSDGYVTGVVLIQGRSAERVLARAGISPEGIQRLLKLAACDDDDTIVYSIEPGFIQVLERVSSFWIASGYDINRIYETCEDASAAAELGIKKLRARFPNARGTILTRVSLLDAVRDSAAYLIPGWKTIDAMSLARDI